MSIPAPTDLAYGLVVGRVIRSVADGDDEDDYPDTLAPRGTGVFTPVATLDRTEQYSALVVKEEIPFGFDSNGNICLLNVDDTPRPPGVWLTTGVWRARFNLVAAAIPEFRFEVTAAHTSEAPLDLVHAAPPTPGEGVTIVTVNVPAGGWAGAVLGYENGGIAWVQPESALDETAILNAYTGARNG